jgi:hypothetical protein
MPITRVCPNCSNLLADFDNYFCSQCSAQLPEDATKLPVSLKIREFSALFPLFYRPQKAKKILKPKKQKDVEVIPDTRKRSFNEKMIIVLSMVLILLSTVFLALYVYLHFYKTITPKQVTLPTSNKKLAKIVDLNLAAPEANFGKNTLIAYAPSSTVLYAEFSDVGYFADKVGADLFSMEDADFELLTKQLTKEFIIFSFKYEGITYWAGVFKPIDFEKTAFFVKTFENPNFILSVEEKNLLVLQKDTPKEALTLIQSVKKGQSLNLSLNPAFIKAMNSLPATGQVRVAVLEKTEREGLLRQLSQNLTQPEKELFVKVLSSGFNELVIKKIK